MATIIKSDYPNARKPYTVRYRDSPGTQRERSFVTREEACAFSSDQERAKRYGSDVNLTAAPLPFNDAVETWLANVRGATSAPGPVTSALRPSGSPSPKSPQFDSVGKDPRSSKVGVLRLTEADPRQVYPQSWRDPMWIEVEDK